MKPAVAASASTAAAGRPEGSSRSGSCCDCSDRAFSALNARVPVLVDMVTDRSLLPFMLPWTAGLLVSVYFSTLASDIQDAKQDSEDSISVWFNLSVSTFALSAVAVFALTSPYVDARLRTFAVGALALAVIGTAAISAVVKVGSLPQAGVVGLFAGLVIMIGGWVAGLVVGARICCCGLRPSDREDEFQRECAAHTRGLLRRDPVESARLRRVRNATRLDTSGQGLTNAPTLVGTPAPSALATAASPKSGGDGPGASDTSTQNPLFGLRDDDEEGDPRGSTPASSPTVPALVESLSPDALAELRAAATPTWADWCRTMSQWAWDNVDHRRPPAFRFSQRMCAAAWLGLASTILGFLAFDTTANAIQSALSVVENQGLQFSQNAQAQVLASQNVLAAFAQNLGLSTTYCDCLAKRTRCPSSRALDGAEEVGTTLPTGAALASHGRALQGAAGCATVQILNFSSVASQCRMCAQLQALADGVTAANGVSAGTAALDLDGAMGYLRQAYRAANYIVVIVMSLQWLTFLPRYRALLLALRGGGHGRSSNYVSAEALTRLQPFRQPGRSLGPSVLGARFASWAASLSQRGTRLRRRLASAMGGGGGGSARGGYGGAAAIARRPDAPPDALGEPDDRNVDALGLTGVGLMPGQFPWTTVSDRRFALDWDPSYYPPDRATFLLTMCVFNTLFSYAICAVLLTVAIFCLLFPPIAEYLTSLWSLYLTSIIAVAVDLVFRYGVVRVSLTDTTHLLQARLFHLVELAYIFYNSLSGVLVAATRLAYALLVNILVLVRPDVQSFAALRSLDVLHSAYVAAVLLDHRHNHPVVRFFAEDVVWARIAEKAVQRLAPTRSGRREVPPSDQVERSWRLPNGTASLLPDGSSRSQCPQCCRCAVCPCAPAWSTNERIAEGPCGRCGSPHLRAPVVEDVVSPLTPKRGSPDGRSTAAPDASFDEEVIDAMWNDGKTVLEWRRQNARFRWQLAYTLLHNPSLAAWRKDARLRFRPPTPVVVASGSMSPV